jgi:hypothetical protein
MIIGRILPREVTPPTTRSFKEQGKGKDESSGFEDALVTELTSAIEKTSEDGKEQSKQNAEQDKANEYFQPDEFIAIASESVTDSPGEIKVKKLNIEA